MEGIKGTSMGKGGGYDENERGKGVRQTWVATEALDLVHRTRSAAINKSNFRYEIRLILI